MDDSNIKVNFVTFINYKEMWFKNVIWMRNFKSLGKIFASFYDHTETIEENSEENKIVSSMEDKRNQVKVELSSYNLEEKVSLDECSKRKRWKS